MAHLTHYVVRPFVRNEVGCLVPEDEIELPNWSAAKSKALLLAPSKAGVLAIMMSENPSRGKFDPPVIFARYGETHDTPE